MTHAELVEYRRKLDAFSDTELGKLFIRFENAHANAWVVDSTSDSTKRMKDAWAKSDEARNAFLTKLAELIGVEAPTYTKS